MTGVRRALIVATDDYTDPKLTRLQAPANDARALADVLRDESVGGFEVETILNRPCHDVEVAIARFFAGGKRGDTLLTHFSCHGVKDVSGELYFATTDTDLSLLKVTGVSSALVRQAMEDSRASLILCLVDCCYSGAFTKSTKAAATTDLTERLGGHGRAIITASTSLQLALDGQEEPSLFTRAVVDGLRSGDADRDLDGLVSLDELYSYVHEQVTARNPDQTPVKSFDVQGEVYVARRSAPVDTPAPLEPDLLADARAAETWKRLGAVTGLAAVLDEGHPGRSLAARQQLERLADTDDSLSVRKAARRVLDAAGALPMPAIPDYQPVGATRGGPAVEDQSAVEGTPQADVTHSDRRNIGGSDAPADTEPMDESPTDEEPRDSGGGPTPGPGRISRIAVAAGVVAGVLVSGGLAWSAIGGDGSTSGGGSGGEAGPSLPETTLLMTSKDADGRHLIKFDAQSSQTEELKVSSAVFPTISADREWMVYLADVPGAAGRVPLLARVDGSEQKRLLDSDSAAKFCPYTSRPAFSPDGGFLTAVCLDRNGDPKALGVVNRDGALDKVLYRGTDLAGAPTWGGDGRIYFMRDPDGDGEQPATLWSIPSDGGQPEQLTDGLDGSDSHPDWSDNGLLFLRTRPDGSSDVYVMDLDSRGVTQVTSSHDADSPTWAPGNEPYAAWLQPATGKRFVNTLWVGEVGPGDESPTELNSGDFGPPAWGSR